MFINYSKFDLLLQEYLEIRKLSKYSLIIQNILKISTKFIAKLIKVLNIKELNELIDFQRLDK